MKNTHLKKRYGLTLIELMITMLIALLVFAGIGVAMVDSIKAFPQMYERTEGDVITDAYVARATFDAACRKATFKNAGIDTTNGAWVIVYYYANPTLSVAPDLSAKFEFTNGQLLVSYGDGSALNFGTPIVLANNVTAGKFEIQGRTVLMTLTIDNINDNNAKKKVAISVTATALRHNE
jgi:prepilin-type N-terminal cleavage/methylation domain-containing protein